MDRVLPDSVIVDGIAYDVRIVSETEMFDESKRANLLGHYNGLTNVLCVLNTLTPSAQEATLLHEVIHAIDNHHALNLSEQEVASLGVCITAFLKANGFWCNSHKEGKHGTPK